MADQYDLAEQLLGLAVDDEAALRAMVDVPAVTDAIVGFHAQQTVEKALKSVSPRAASTSRSPTISEPSWISATRQGSRSRPPSRMPGG